MLDIEINGQATQVEPGKTVMDAANQLGVYIPHFCYHKKLSIAANCRMCLVQVEKAPKPLPACATPVTNGMKVQTHSEMAVTAQKGVMEFLLINHPLDCPICDQGGECQLQDLAVGYGGSGSRYQEEKRVVFHKNVGPLISMEEMSRCIHCTRCVRFGQEIAGIMELGMMGRGEHSEIVSFVGRSVDSELSGNMIDLCPVGALTSKPFRYTARNWELSRRKSVSPHDGLGANLVVQVKNNRVMRVLPQENEAVNECWLADKDRYSYEGLNSAQRLTRPMIKQDGSWREVEWQNALEYVATGLKDVAAQRGGVAIGALATPHSTLEELYLLQKLARGLGSDNVDHRLRQADFSADAQLQGVPWLGMAIADVNALDRILVVGSTLRKDHPLLAHRMRQAVKKGAQFNLINPVDDDLLMPVANKTIVAPAQLAAALAQVLKAALQAKGVAVPAQFATLEVGAAAQAIAASLMSGANAAIFLGNMAQHHPAYAQLHALAQQLADASGAKFGILGEAANSVGAWLAGAVPGTQGLNAAAMLAQPRQAYILLNVEAELDSHDPQAALAAMRAADMVVAMSAYKHAALDYADVLLPIAPFTETAGTFVNTEGLVQSFNGAVQPLGEARPAWKVLRVLGNMLGVAGFDYDSAEQVRAEVLRDDVRARLVNRLRQADIVLPAAGNGLQRIGEVPIYQADAVVRRADSLQKTADAALPAAWMHSATLAQCGVRAGDVVTVKQGGGSATLVARCDDRLPQGSVRVAAGHPATATLGAMFGTVSVAHAEVAEKVGA
ncbi:MAG: NADH-quinone oxidoreductase subunit NuoG [Pseudomonadota bacterium]